MSRYYDMRNGTARVKIVFDVGTISGAVELDLDREFYRSLMPLPRDHDMPYSPQAYAAAKRQREGRATAIKILAEQFANAVYDAVVSKDPRNGYTREEAEQFGAAARSIRGPEYPAAEELRRGDAVVLNADGSVSKAKDMKLQQLDRVGTECGRELPLPGGLTYTCEGLLMADPFHGVVCPKCGKV